MSTLDQQLIEVQAKHLVLIAQKWGLVLTIETQPRQPLAMGHYEIVVDVRPARHPAPAPAVQHLPADDTEGGQA